MNWTQEDLDRRNREVLGSKATRKTAEATIIPDHPRHKYGAQKTTVDGIRFDSKVEANAYLTLKALLAMGQIADLKLQPRFLLQEAFRDGSGKTHRQIEYRGDFEFQRGEEHVVVEVKGFATEAWRIKEKLFRFKYPEIKLEIWK